jgi:homoserine O-acetyltransferase
LFAGYFPTVVLENMSADEMDVMIEDYVDEALFLDVHDIHFRNKCILNYDVEDKLSKIKAESLILGIKGILLFNPITDGILSIEDKIENCTVKIFDSTKEDYENGNYSEMFVEFATFLKQFKI